MAVKTSAGVDYAARFDELVLSKAGARDKASIEKHISLAETDGDGTHAQLWRKLAGMLASLAPMPVQTIGGHALMFFVPDGKYRMQVFALEDKRDGLISVYLPDVLNPATREKIVQKEGAGYAVGGSRGQLINMTLLSAQNSTDPAQHVKNLTGWNRKALKVSLMATELDSPQVNAVEALAKLAAKKWADAAKATVAAK